MRQRRRVDGRLLGGRRGGRRRHHLGELNLGGHRCSLDRSALITLTSNGCLGPERSAAQRPPAVRAPAMPTRSGASPGIPNTATSSPTCRASAFDQPAPLGQHERGLPPDPRSTKSLPSSTAQRPVGIFDDLGAPQERRPGSSGERRAGSSKLNGLRRRRAATRRSASGVDGRPPARAGVAGCHAAVLADGRPRQRKPVRPDDRRQDSPRAEAAQPACQRAIRIEAATSIEQRPRPLERVPTRELSPWVTAAGQGA